MRFHHKLMWKSKQRKPEEVDNVQLPGVPLPVVQPVAVESRTLELTSLEDMADAHYSLPVPRGIEDRFTARYLQTFKSNGVVFEFKQFDELQSLVTLLFQQAQRSTLPSLDNFEDVETSEGSELDNGAIATLTSSSSLAGSDTIEDIYDFYAIELHVTETTLVNPSVFTAVDVTSSIDDNRDDKNTTCDNPLKTDVSESTDSEETSNLLVASPDSLAIVKYQPNYKLSPIISAVATPRRLCIFDFIVVTLLGQGGFGTVLLVFDTISRRFFALKVILKSNMNTKEMQYVFEEQRIGRALSDSKLLMGIAGSWEDTKNFFMLMPFAAGGDLGHHIRKHGPLSGDALAVVIPQLILAVEEMHGARILNRDLKPANVLLDISGTIKIADFGLSIAFGVSHSDRPWKHKPALHTEGDVCEGACGTSGYMAPEVIRGDKYSYPADTFSLGCIFYELLFGCLPFGGYDDLSPIAERYCTLPLEFPVNNELDSDPTTQDLLTKMLDKNPTTRITISQIKEHPAFLNTNWAAVANGQISASVRDKLFKGTRPEDFDMSQAPSPPPGKPYEDNQEPHAWFHFTGTELTGPPANPSWVPTPPIKLKSTNLPGSRNNSRLGPFGRSGNVSIPRNLAVINGSNLMSSGDFGAQLVMNGSNLMSSDDDDDPETSNNPATPTIPAIIHDLEIVLSAAADEGDDVLDDPSMASECAAFIQDLLGAKSNINIRHPRSRRMFLD